MGPSDASGPGRGRRRLAGRLAWSLAALSGALVVAGLVLLYLDRAAIGTDLVSVLGTTLGSLAGAVIASLLGAIVATRHPRNPIGWLSLALGLSNGAYVAFEAIAVRALLAGLPPTGWVAWLAVLGNVANVGGVVTWPLILLLFPGGRLTGRLSRWLAWLAVAVNFLLTATVLLDPAPQQIAPGLPVIQNPFGVAALSGFSAQNGSSWPLVALLAIVLAATALLLLRLRHSTGDERQQLKWFAYGSGLVGVILLAFVAAIVAGSSGTATPVGVAGGSIAKFLGSVVLPSIPVVVLGTVGVGILRYRLYDIDVVISRTLVYGSLAAFISAVYVAIVVGVGAAIGQGGRPNLGLSIVATGVVAVGFQPVRERLQRLANRLVYGRRATPYEVLSLFSEKVAETYAGNEVLARMATVLAEGTVSERAEVWLHVGDELSLAAESPKGGNGSRSVPVVGQLMPEIPGVDRAVGVRHQGELLGVLAVTKRRGEALTPIEENLLRDLANQAGLVLKNVGLTADLQARLEDLRASRQRLVAAQDQERRRLERDLHDGAQQQLIALKVKLGLVDVLAGKDPERAWSTLKELKGDADEALETLRALARGIYPPLLADRGLVAALESHARKATVPVAVDAADIGRYPQEVETAVYFCVLEALQNVQKYASASSAAVRIRADDGQLRFSVGDDGHGFDLAAVRRGAGLTNMADRIEALGGTIQMASSPGGGTTVSASIPVTD